MRPENTCWTKQKNDIPYFLCGQRCSILCKNDFDSDDKFSHKINDSFSFITHKD